MESSTPEQHRTNFRVVVVGETEDQCNEIRAALHDTAYELRFHTLSLDNIENALGGESLDALMLAVFDGSVLLETLTAKKNF